MEPACSLEDPPTGRWNTDRSSPARSPSVAARGGGGAALSHRHTEDFARAVRRQKSRSLQTFPPLEEHILAREVSGLAGWGDSRPRAFSSEDM